MCIKLCDTSALSLSAIRKEKKNWYLLLSYGKSAPELVLQRNTANFVYFVAVTGRYGFEGKLQITQPMLNYRSLTADDLADKKSADYNFLMRICTDIVSKT